MADLNRLLYSSPKPPYVTLAKMSKDAVTATSGTALPSDYGMVICGYTSAGQYVPAQNIRAAEAMADSGAEQIYAKAGKFYGTADLALYWAAPSQTITNTSTTLTEYPDAFYHAAKYQAALYLLPKEDADARDRFAQIAQELQRKILSLA